MLVPSAAEPGPWELGLSPGLSPQAANELDANPQDLSCFLGGLPPPFPLTHCSMSPLLKHRQGLEEAVACGNWVGGTPSTETQTVSRCARAEGALWAPQGRDLHITRPVPRSSPNSSLRLTIQHVPGLWGPFLGARFRAER